MDDHLMNLIAHDRLERLYAEADNRRLLRSLRRSRQATPSKPNDHRDCHDTEEVSFLAGKVARGGNVWGPASVEDREVRDDGEWLYALPAFPDDAARWVKASDVRIPKSSRANEPSEPAGTAVTSHLRVGQ